MHDIDALILIVIILVFFFIIFENAEIFLHASFRYNVI